MSIENVKRDVINYWLDKANEALAAAQDDFHSGRYAFAVNRAYYAGFYALSSVLLSENQKFVKHTGVRGALHRTLIKPGRVTPELGRFYDRLFDNRQRADYQELVVFDREQTEELLSGTIRFVSEMRKLLPGDLVNKAL